MDTSYPTGSNSASDSSEISSQLNTGSFDIRDHLDKLTPGKEKDKYICPVCNGNNLGIESKTGAYQCWTGGCSNAAIREAIRPWSEVVAEREAAKKESGNQKTQKKVVAVKSLSKQSVQVPMPAGMKLLKLPTSQCGPEPQKPQYLAKGIPADALQITYVYSTSQVLRFEWLDPQHLKGGDKTCRQTHVDGNAKRVWTKGDLPWPAYGIDEVVEILSGVPIGEPIAVLMLGGEPNVELARLHGVAAVTLQGSGWNDSEITGMVEALRATGKNVALVKLRDNDAAGIKKGDRVQLICDRLQFPCLVINPVAIYPDIPNKGDIREILEKMNIEEFIRRLEAEIHNAAAISTPNISLTPHARTRDNVVCQKYDSRKSNYIPDAAPIALQNFVQKAEAALYASGHWVSIGGQLYHHVGSHYELQSEAEEKRRIGDWLNTYAEEVKGKWVNNRAKSSNVAEVLNWVMSRTAVDPNQINPDGLNCSNGVVRINPDGSHSLVLHDPKQIYTYVGCKYDPGIDPTDGDRLLECLEPSQREVFLRTAAAALNLKLVRSKLTGRGVKGLLCHGERSNGKDTLRAVLVAVFGRGMTGKSLSDFKSYDNGRKFSLAGIEGSICNWASENTAKVDLDSIQSLKQLIAGDPIDIERKGKDSYEYKPAAIFFANCNKLPSITGGTAAIDDRYGILSFKKTYKRDADLSGGELEADPRFKDDENFVLERIAPAMLNKILERLPLLLTEGIDYKATREAMREAQEESRHLWQFAREVGLEVQSGGRVWVADLWQQLQGWYVESGILEIEVSDKNKQKLVWNELSNKYDAPVKAVNQLYARLCEIFPKVQIHRYNGRDEVGKKGQKYLLGIGFVQSLKESHKIELPGLPVDTARVTGLPSELPENTSELPENIGNPVGNPVGNSQTLTHRAGHPGNPVSSPFTEVCNLFSQLTDSDRQKLV
ncbi:DUF5906 domain-containing protein [Microcoleus sp. herbarium14]|uniref:DUF5906 domain-containing protein n=1 Tax=Microcoleus sp. herbarium14 TaxID=3055439 RepID=UPI002FD524E6